MGLSNDDFSSSVLRVDAVPPSPLPRAVMYAVLLLFAVIIAWSFIGRLDIIAVAQGKLVPAGYVKIVQPPESGIVKEILVQEGEEIATGQILMRMDEAISSADSATIETDLALRELQLRRISAELNGGALLKRESDRDELYAQTVAQYRANRTAYQDQLESERAVLLRAKQELGAAQQLQARLQQTLPIYVEQESVHEKLAQDGFVSRLVVLDKSRARIEKEQELKAQVFQVASLRAAVDQSRNRLAQITSTYRQTLQNERAEANAERLRLVQQLGKQNYRRGLLELKAPYDGVVKDLATHTIGTVVSPGSILMTVVPHNDPVKAEVWITNVDAGFVREGLPVKVKVAAYPFQKYGMVTGVVEYVSPDAAELPDTRERDRRDQKEHVMPPSGFRGLVTLDETWLERDGRRFALNSGMLVSAEIHIGERTVMEYLFSPIQKAVQESGREF